MSSNPAGAFIFDLYKKKIKNINCSNTVKFENFKTVKVFWLHVLIYTLISTGCHMPS